MAGPWCRQGQRISRHFANVSRRRTLKTCVLSCRSVFAWYVGDRRPCPRLARKRPPKTRFVTKCGLLAQKTKHGPAGMAHRVKSCYGTPWLPRSRKAQVSEVRGVSRVRKSRKATHVRYEIGSPGFPPTPLSDIPSNGACCRAGTILDACSPNSFLSNGARDRT